jgi:acyl-CoA synthetase (AMP-forming)/AMP-acid ligase II
LVLFTTGSTGLEKAAVHDMSAILQRFQRPRPAMRTVPFLLYDHIGGVNTMLHVLANGGCLVIADERTPDGVLQTVSRHQVELLPTSPTFLNLVLFSEAYQRHDLSSLKLITYGTEPMPASTLRRFNQLFPRLELRQTYGLSEIGILHSKSRSSDSLWVKLGGEGFETRVVDGMLEVRAQSSMLGYLNAPSPLTTDGWFPTGDLVDVDGEYLRILGRKSDIINVGGEKVFPTEVEGVIAELDNVAEVTVFAEENAIVGQVLCASVWLNSAEEPAIFVARLKRYCSERLARYKVPVRVSILSTVPSSPRFKKKRPRTCDRG